MEMGTQGGQSMLDPDSRGDSGDSKQGDNYDVYVGKKGYLDFDENNDLSFQDGAFATGMCRRKRGKGIRSGCLQ